MIARGITVIRRTKYLMILPRISKLLGKSFGEATKEDIKKVVVTIRSLELADWTKSDILICMKRFYNYLYELPPGQQPPQTAWVRVKRVSGRLLPEQLLTEQDVKKLANQCENSRDKAFVLALYETGGRIAELLNLRRKHLTFDSYGAVLLVSGKTGDRRVRIITSAPALAQWIDDHPDKDPDSRLWTIIGDRNHGEPLLYDSARALLKRLASMSIRDLLDRARLNRNGCQPFWRLLQSSVQSFGGINRPSSPYSIWLPLARRKNRQFVARLPALRALKCPECSSTSVVRVECGQEGSLWKGRLTASRLGQRDHRSSHEKDHCN
jgi:site-specific recombinase XerD